MSNLPRLPAVEDGASYQELWPSDEPWREFVQALAQRHGLSEAPLRFRSGTAVAYRLSDHVLKLYPPFAARDAAIETHVLAQLAGAEELPTPRPIDHGRQDGWAYLLMTHVPGVPIEQAWSERPRSEQRALARQAGSIARALHAQPVSALPRADGDFAEFRRACRQRADSYHVARGFPAARAAELSDFLSDLDREPELDLPHVLLHTELGPGHLLVQDGQIRGLIDFGEARLGPPEYDFAAVGLFVTRGERASFAAFLDAYGVPQERRGMALIRRLMRHALLHEYGHLSFYLRQSPLAQGMTLPELAEHWFGH